MYYEYMSYSEPRTVGVHDMAARPKAQTKGTFALALHLPRGTVPVEEHTPFVLGRGLHTLDDDPRLSRQLAVLAFDGHSPNATLTCAFAQKSNLQRPSPSLSLRVGTSKAHSGN